MASNRFEQETRLAVAEASQGRVRTKDDERRNRVRGGADYLIDVIRLLLTLAAVALVVALIDGARREYGEFYANLVAFKPQVAVRRNKDKLPVAEKMQLQDKDAISTASNGNATLAFPDGSAIRVEPNTKFEVQLLDYNRGPKRDRSFLLRNGSVFTRISKLFGKRGQTLICTPNAVSAARGTGFSVRFDPSANSTFVEVIDGKVALRNAGGRIEIKKGQTGTAIGNQPPFLGVVGRPQALTQQFNNLARLDPPQTPLEKFERDALGLLNPVLQMVALTPRGWNLAENDWSRRAATRRGLNLLQQSLEAVTGDVPDTLNPVSMSELGLDDVERAKILETFAGFTIDRYEKRGQNSYRVVVRSRDSAGTTFQLTESGVDEVK
ncbi:MAG: FecR domain-containing protein [Fibrella sp.]|nr:FecR domain-containing protein [Armatimonadota bacterium]